MNLLNTEIVDCANLVDSLHSQGVILAAEDGDLRVYGPETILGKSDVINAISAHKPQIIAHLDRIASANADGPGMSVDPEQRHAPFPLTDIQRAYWVGRQNAFDHGSVSIHYYTETDIEGLDLKRLQAAWDATVIRHDMLRAVVDDDAMQRILPDVPQYEIPLIDLSAMSGPERDACLATHRETASHTVHQTDRWPGFALAAFNLGNNRFRLSYSQDLLHVDGGSLLRIIGDFCSAYTDPDTPLSPITVSFRDYVFHEIAQKQKPVYQNGLAYWKGVVEDLPPPPMLPVRHQKPDAGQDQGGRFRRLVFELPPQAYDAIKTQSRDMGITPTGWVMAVFGEIISRWSGSEDCTLNVTVFNRPNLGNDLLNIAGDFTSMMPVPVRRAEGDDLASRARDMQHSLWHHMKHRDVSGITILDLLRTARGDHNAAALSVVYTSLLNLSGQGFDPRGFGAIGTPVYTLTQTPQVTLDHQVSETPSGGIAFSWDVVEGHYPDGMIDDMFEAFQELATRLATQSDVWKKTANDQMDYLPSTQVALIEALDQTPRGGTAMPDANTTLRDMLEAARAAGPEALAVATPTQDVTHDRLHAAARRLAARLAAAGVRQGDRVGILMEKGFAQPIAVLATHMAGAAYVPIDPTVPEARFAHIAKDADLRICLTDSAFASQFPDHPLQRVLVDEGLLDTSGASDRPEALTALPPLQSGDVSHVIYTSGSTGLPKGVMITHGNVANRLRDIISRFDIGGDDRAIGLTALHHDLSVFDIFGVLAAGGALVLPAEEARLDPEAWLAQMRRHRVTLWNSVPAFAGMMADYLQTRPAAEVKNLPPLRWMILAGDWIPVPLPDQLRLFWPKLDIIASGGPTETTIWDIWNRIGEVDPNWSSIPYGKPLANAGYHILDASGRRCPVWVPGELHITGAGVTKGYLNRPEETAARYLQLPGIEGTVFRSGDLGRVLPDGNIEFLGRNDFQIKINGQRIELGEIERVALSVDGVRDCVAVVQTGASGKSLAAFITAEGADTSPDTQSEQSAFEDRQITRSDPAQRLEAKLAYRSLVPQGTAHQLHPLGTPVPGDSRLRSWRNFSATPLSLEALNRFLSPLHGARMVEGSEARFAYASGGGLYPIQIYMYLKHDLAEGMPAGIWRYYPFEHALELVSEGALPHDIHWGYNRAWADKAPFYVYLVADLEEITAQYGDIATSMCQIEVGSVLQLLRHAAAETGFGVCAVGDISFPRTADRFALSEHQKFMLALVAGEIAADGDEAGPATEVPLTEQVHTALMAVLPRHMVPQSITRLDTLPLTGNGKVDRKALIAMETGPDTGGPAAVIAPEGDFETTVAAILAGLLNRDQVSATDNFFDIGAGSALLVKAYHQIKAETGCDFPLISLFRFPSIRRLSEQIGAGSAGAAPASAEPSSHERDRAGRQTKAISRLSSFRKKGK
ncbi:MAG: amino acid adenylation domain-containing protein [Albidovulum sp.]|uniref:amino acid adenylation domain-containing protein n=1 Tax=Albidovulum sp. TaxID=1872424 RepID=UPI003C9D6268